MYNSKANKFGTYTLDQNTYEQLREIIPALPEFNAEGDTIDVTPNTLEAFCLIVDALREIKVSV